MQITPEQVAVIVQWATQTSQIAAVYLFGSRIKGTARPDSDLDVAIEFNLSIDDAEVAFFDGGRLWRDQLKSLVGLQIDMQPLLEDSPNLRRYVEDHGILIYRSRQKTY